MPCCCVTFRVSQQDDVRAASSSNELVIRCRVNASWGGLWWFVPVGCFQQLPITKQRANEFFRLDVIPCLVRDEVRHIEIRQWRTAGREFGCGDKIRLIGDQAQQLAGCDAPPSNSALPIHARE